MSELEVLEFVRKPFPVSAVRITAENMEDVAKWCSGVIRDVKGDDLFSRQLGDKFVKVNVHNPLNERQTKGFVGDWVLYAGKGFKVYTNKAFRKSFENEPRLVPQEPLSVAPTPITNVFTGEPVNNQNGVTGTMSPNLGHFGKPDANNPGGTRKLS